MLTDYWRAITKRWFTTMSGPFAVPASLLSAYLTSGGVRAVSLVTAFAGFVFTTYWVWRAERLRVNELEETLDPKLSLRFEPGRSPFVTATRLTGALVGRDGVLYVRILPTCNAQVTGCKGILKRVLKLTDGVWRTTAFNEAQSLVWSNHPDQNDRQIRLDPGIDQCLDVLRVSQFSGEIEVPLAGARIPNNAVDVFRSGGVFRFDVAVVGDGHAHAEISLKVQTGKSWDSPTIEVLAA